MLIVGDFRRKIILFVFLAALWAIMYFVASIISTSAACKNEGVYSRDPANYYMSQKFHFTFQYPKSVIMSGSISYGGEIPFHMDFSDKQNKLNSFIQVWVINSSVSDFLKESLKVSELHYKSFINGGIKLGGTAGIFWDYSVIKQNNEEYLGKEYFVGKNGYMYRLSFFTTEPEWQSESLNNIESIVQSFRFI